MTTQIPEGLCAGPCMHSFRRKVRAYEAAIIQYRSDLTHYLDVLLPEHGEASGQWYPPLIWDLVAPVEPAEPEPPRLPYPIPGDPVFCSQCVYDLKAKLSKLDGAACVYLRESDGMRGQNDEAKVSKSADPGSPSLAIEELDDLDWWLRSWKAAYLGVDSIARQGGLADSITLGCAWLVVRAERILAREGMALDFGGEIDAWYNRLRVYDPSEVVVKRMKTRCPGCQRRTLEWAVGEDKVVCRMRDCERVLKLTEYRDLEDEEKTTRKVP